MHKRTDDRDRRAFITRLRRALQLRGVSQNELARMIGSTSQGVSGWFANEAYPGGEFMVRLPRALNVSGHWLLTGEGEMAPAIDGGMENAFGMGARTAIAETRAALDELEARWTPKAART